MITIPSRFKEMIVETPLCTKSRGDQTKYDDLAETLKLLDATKSVKLSIPEAHKLFGKCWKYTIKRHMKMRGVKKIRVGVKNDTIYIWENR